jgi:hypothetical protein
VVDTYLTVQEAGFDCHPFIDDLQGPVGRTRNDSERQVEVAQDIDAYSFERLALMWFIAVSVNRFFVTPGPGWLGDTSFTNRLF